MHKIKYSKKELELIGSALYKCEGTRFKRDKRYPNTFRYSIEFTNSDPILIQHFIKFLREVIRIEEERLRCNLYIYNDLNKEKVKKFWSSKTQIPLKQFHKTTILIAKNSKYKPNPLGTCKIRYHDKKAYLKLNTIIKKRLGEEAKLIKQF